MDEKNNAAVRADTDGWQIACWKLAKSRNAFEVEGFSDHHLAFFQELRSAYDFEIKLVDHKAIFVPQPSA